ncbi:hypothetical protein ABIA39_000281 [Nocardia sp. GAS34]|uniref:hypothetical protein n=1 Tax=unclassified Nocardia TaxID=2637762 RepID=UPI003D1DF2F9
MTTHKIPGPRLSAADIIGGPQQRNDVTVLTERHGVPVRYRLHVDRYIAQSHFLVEAWDPGARTWNELWAIPQATYTFPGAREHDAAPAWRLIASPDVHDPHAKAASWQQIIDTLTEYADRILTLRTPPGPR